MTVSLPTRINGCEQPARRIPRLAMAILAVAGMLAVPLLSPQSASATTRSPLSHTAAELAMIGAVGRTMNSERVAHGLPRVTLNSDLVMSARRHDLAMAHANTLSHQLPGEAYFANRMTAAGYRWTYAGENIGWNSQMTTAGVVQLEVTMYNEKAPNDGHRLNILSRNFRDVGIDVYLDNAHHKVWLTTDFGRH